VGVEKKHHDWSIALNRKYQNQWKENSVTVIFNFVYIYKDFITPHPNTHMHTHMHAHHTHTHGYQEIQKQENIPYWLGMIPAPENHWTPDLPLTQRKTNRRQQRELAKMYSPYEDGTRIKHHSWTVLIKIIFVRKRYKEDSKKRRETKTDRECNYSYASKWSLELWSVFFDVAPLSYPQENGQCHSATAYATNKWS